MRYAGVRSLLIGMIGGGIGGVLAVLLVGERGVVDADYGRLERRIAALEASTHSEAPVLRPTAAVVIVPDSPTGARPSEAQTQPPPSNLPEEPAADDSRILTFGEALAALPRRQYAEKDFADLYGRQVEPTVSRVSPPLTETQMDEVRRFVSLQGAEFLDGEGVRTALGDRLSDEVMQETLRRHGAFKSALRRELKTRILRPEQVKSIEYLLH